MKQLIYILSVLLFGLPLSIKASEVSTDDDFLSATVTETTPQTSWLVEVTLSSAANSNYTAFQMDVVLPKGFHYAEGSVTAGVAIPTHTVVAAQHPDGFLRIAAYSGGNLAIGSGEKPLVSFRLEADGEMAAIGMYPLLFRNLLFSLRTGTSVKLQNITAQLISSEKKPTYHIIYMVDGEVYQDMEVEAGAPVTPPEAPVKEGHTFDGWEGLPDVMPSEDITVTARFSVNSYKASYYLNEELYATQNVAYGSTLAPPEVTPQEGYTFSGWKDIPATMPARDISIHGTLDKANGIETVTTHRPVDVYNLQGILVRKGILPSRLSAELPAGVYIVNGRLTVIR